MTDDEIMELRAKGKLTDNDIVELLDVDARRAVFACLDGDGCRYCSPWAALDADAGAQAQPRPMTPREEVSRFRTPSSGTPCST